MFAIFDSATLFGILKGNRFLPLGGVFVLLFDKGTLVLESVKEDLAVHDAILCLLLKTEARKRRRQFQNRIELVGVNHVNHAHSIGLHPVGRIIRQDLGIGKHLDDGVHHQHVAEEFGTKGGSLANVAFDKLRSRTTHASPIQHGLRIVHTGVRNIRLAEPTRVGSSSTRQIQNTQFLLVNPLESNFTKRGPNVAIDIGCVKQGVLEGSLKVVPRILRCNALAFLVLKSFCNPLQSDAVQDNAQDHQNYDGRPHYLSSRQKGCWHRRSRSVLFGIHDVASLDQQENNQEIQSGHQPFGGCPTS